MQLTPRTFRKRNDIQEGGSKTIQVTDVMRLMPKAPIRITEVTPVPGRKGWTSTRRKLYERGGIAQGVGYKALPPELGLRVVDEIRATGDGWQELIIYKYRDFDIDEL